MNLLNKICSYWYECIKNEDVLEKDISINVRTKAILYPFDNDPFVFNLKNKSIDIKGDKLAHFAIAKTEGFDFFYGFPLLFYFDERMENYLVAPLFIMKVKFIHEGDTLTLSKDDIYPVCGIQALTRLGLRTEEIADINQSIEQLFAKSINVSSRELVKKSLEIIQKEAELSIIEEIDPDILSNSKKFEKKMKPGIYNKSLVFTGETSIFNIHLIKDLLELKDRGDLGESSLAFFDGSSQADVTPEDKKIPVLPFPSNEYQITAIQDIFKHSLSVITGPPGTGKSQFIANLIINLFLEDKSVLFVSHTGEAVDVVNSKINEQFRNLMLRTGNKPLRQELKGKFNELIADHSKRGIKNIQIDYVHSLWRTILEYRNSLRERERFELDFQNKYLHKKELENLLQIQTSFFKKLKIYFELFIFNFKLQTIKSKLEKSPSKIHFETKIRELEKEFYVSCQEFVRNIYTNKMLGSGIETGLANT